MIHSLSVTGSGEINGNVKITLILNGEAYKTDSVTFHWGGDWYSDQAEIQYAPKSVTGGSLKLRLVGSVIIISSC